jgi:hypothetical protein
MEATRPSETSVYIEPKRRGIPEDGIHQRNVYSYPPVKEARELYSDIETKLRGLSPRANYTDRATAACRRS